MVGYTYIDGGKHDGQVLPDSISRPTFASLHGVKCGGHNYSTGRQKLLLYMIVILAPVADPFLNHTLICMPATRMVGCNTMTGSAGGKLLERRPIELKN